MVPVATTLIPLFVIYNTGGLYNTRLGLILVYIASAISFSVYLLSGYMRALPDEILEASVIDGCNIYAMMWHIVMPLMKNALITVVVIQFFFKWNDLLYSMTLISSSSLKTMQTGLLYFSDEFGSKNWGAIFASVSISVTPMLLMYLLLNKMVIEGMTAGAIKG
jgi:raffinose/stachyose/melibiose transport system permease protein